MSIAFAPMMFKATTSKTGKWSKITSDRSGKQMQHRETKGARRRHQHIVILLIWRLGDASRVSKVTESKQFHIIHHYLLSSSTHICLASSIII